MTKRQSGLFQININTYVITRGLHIYLMEDYYFHAEHSLREHSVNEEKLKHQISIMLKQN